MVGLELNQWTDALLGKTPEEENGSSPLVEPTGTTTVDVGGLLNQATLGLAEALRIYHRHRIRGFEHLIEALGGERPLILVGNHCMDIVDPLMLGAAVYRETGRVLRFIAHEKMFFSNPVLRSWVSGLGCVPHRQMPAADAVVRAGETLVIYPLNGSFNLAWEVDFKTDRPLGRWRVHVDAHTGAVLEAQNRIQYGNVSGEVYLKNPVRDPNLVVVGLRDAYVTRNSQTTVTDAAGDYDDLGATTVDTDLSGPWADLINEDVADATYTGPPDVLWSYPVSNTHFDEVNTFYHVNIFHDYVRGTLNSTASDSQLPVTVHVGDYFNNAYYDGTGIYFGDGDGSIYADFAQDDVIYHEYGHFMFDAAISMGYGANEVGGMQEGGADYFAGSFGDDSVLGEAVVIGGGFIRDLDNKNFNPPRIYPDYLIDNGYEPHAGGEVWGGAVWDIRKQIGAVFTDPVAWEALYYLPPGNAPLFIDGRAGMEQADIDFFLGIHILDIGQLMFERGIGPAPSTDPFVRIVANPAFGIVPLPVLFEGIVIDNGTIVNYYWDLGDGTIVPSGGPDISHVYQNSGSYTVTLTATDDTAATGSYSVQVDVERSGEIVSFPAERDIGHVRSDQPSSNLFGDDDVYGGYLAGTDYRGAALFEVPVIPGGTSNVTVDSATVDFMGQDATAKGPTGGIWTLKMLEAGTEIGWRNSGYLDIVSAPVLYTMMPALANADLISGVMNVFTATSVQLPALQDRIRAGSITFRMDGPYGVNNLFSWDSGYDRFNEDPTAVRTLPVLRIQYTQNRLSGDVNSDGAVDRVDARLVAEAVVGIRTLDTADAEAGDVDRNQVLDERDAAAILQKEAGLVDF